MSSELKDAVQAIANHPQVAAVTSAATMTTSMATIMGSLQGILAVVASIVGIILSAVLCRTHWRKGVLIDLEIAQLKKEIGK